MAQIPILNGIYTDQSPDFRVEYPVNLVPVPMSNGISNGYLRPADGLVEYCTCPAGVDRGGIEYDGQCYRVRGTSLVRVNADKTTTVLGDVGTGGQVTFDYSFDRLAIASGGRLYYWDGTTLSQVTDPDLGTVVDFCWVDGYFLTTDGEFLIVTELNDPFEVNPLKYGSSEIDPDPVKAVIKLRNEVYALNRHTIEVFDNVGGEFFPFQRVSGAQIQKGVLGTHTCCVFANAIAFLGSGRNEPPAIYLGGNSNASKISTREIDQLLLEYTEDQLSTSFMESRVDEAHILLYIHLPDRTIVYDGAASQALGSPIWFVLTSALIDYSQYRAKNLVWCYNQWIFGDPTSDKIGTFDDSISTQFGQNVRWEFGTTILYLNGVGGIINNLELVALTGSVAFGAHPTISTSYSVDGINWSQDKYIRVGKLGQRNKRLAWWQQGHMRTWRIQRFRGDTQAHLSFARLEAAIEPLAY